MKVELGAGRHTHPDWIGLDVNPANADVVADARHLPFADGSVIEMHAVDVLEHLSYRETTAALHEWARVLRPAIGVLFVQVPDADEIMRRYVERDFDRLKVPDDLRATPLNGVQWRLLGGHADGVYVDVEGDWRWNAHYSLWNAQALTRELHDAGFDIPRLEQNEHPNLQCWAVQRP